MTSGPPQGRWANVDDMGEEKLGALPSSHSATVPPDTKIGWVSLMPRLHPVFFLNVGNWHFMGGASFLGLGQYLLHSLLLLWGYFKYTLVCVLLFLFLERLLIY